VKALVGNTMARLLADKGYRGHNGAPDHKLRVFISGQKRGATPKIKRELRRRAAVEPVISHLKAEHHMGRNYLWFRQGDAANAILAAAGYNFRRLPLAQSLAAQIPLRPHRRRSDRSSPKPEFFTDDQISCAEITFRKFFRHFCLLTNLPKQ
jgi:hypothetical protein